MDFSPVTKVSATITALVTLGGLAWGFGDATGYRPWLKREQETFTANNFKLVMDQTQQNTLAIAKSQFDVLWGQRKFGALDFEQTTSLCKNAQILNYAVTDNTGALLCTKDGQPVITFKAPIK